MKNLGKTIKNNINGLHGVASAKSISLSGSVQYLIKLTELDKENKPLKSNWYDEQELSFPRPSEIDSCIKFPDTDIGLGMEVKHLNGFKGTVIEQIWYLNGCLYFSVMPKVDKDNKMPEEVYIPCQYLSIINKKSKTVKKSNTGGESTNAPMM